MDVKTAISMLTMRATELDEKAADHRAEHGRRESKSVRAKYGAQARELRRMATEISIRAGLLGGMGATPTFVNPFEAVGVEPTHHPRSGVRETEPA